MNWFYVGIIIVILGLGEWYFLDMTATTCADGSKMAFPFNRGNLSLLQSGITEDGSAVACTGEIYPYNRCSAQFLPICLMRHYNSEKSMGANRDDKPGI